MHGPRSRSEDKKVQTESPKSTPIADLLAACERDPRCGTVRRLRAQAEELLRQKRDEALRGVYAAQVVARIRSFCQWRNFGHPQSMKRTDTCRAFHPTCFQFPIHCFCQYIGLYVLCATYLFFLV